MTHFPLVTQLFSAKKCVTEGMSTIYIIHLKDCGIIATENEIKEKFIKDEKFSVLVEIDLLDYKKLVLSMNKFEESCLLYLSLLKRLSEDMR